MKKILLKNEQILMYVFLIITVIICYFLRTHYYEKHTIPVEATIEKIVMESPDADYDDEKYRILRLNFDLNGKNYDNVILYIYTNQPLSVGETITVYANKMLPFLCSLTESDDSSDSLISAILIIILLGSTIKLKSLLKKQKEDGQDKILEEEIMKKEDSLKFLNKCISDMENCTPEEINKMKESYEQNCNIDEEELNIER